MSNIKKNLGHVTAYAYYKAGGGTMTEEEFTEYMADFGDAAERAVDAASEAAQSKAYAQTAAATATDKADEAAASASSASGSAASAAEDASTASIAANTATGAATTATNAKNDAVTAKNAAQSAKTAAETAASTATTKAGEAATSATNAAASAQSVASSAAQITQNAEDIDALKEDLSDIRVPYGVNLFNKDAITQGHYVTADGSIAENNLYDLTDYIPVNGYFYVTIPHTGNVNACWYSFYNENKVFDKRLNYSQTAFTLNYKGYIRLNLWSKLNTGGHHDIDEIMINNGNTALPYVPYYTAMDKYTREKAVLNFGYLANNSDLDNIVGNCVYAISSTYTYTNSPIASGYLETFELSSTAKYQIAVEGDTGRTYIRRNLAGVWQAWIDVWGSMISKGAIPNNTDLNTVTDQGVYLVNSTFTYTNAPFSVGTLIVLKPVSTVCIQLGIQYNSGKVSYRKALNGTFGDWVADQYSGKIAMFGDSITWGQLGGEAAGTQTDKGTPYWVSALTHLDATNYGVGGMGWLAESPHESAYDYIQTVDLTDFDFVSFAYGVNDSPKPLGTYLDTVTPGDVSETIMGAIYSTMYYMKQNYPTKTFILISPTLGCNWQGSFPEWNWNKVRTGGWTLKEMTEEYKKFADYYHIPFIDLSHSPINSFNVDFLTGGASDIHPTQAGYDILGRFIAGQLSAICG